MPLTNEQHMSAAVMAKVDRARDLAEAGDFRGARAIRDQLNASTAHTASIGAIAISMEIARALRFRHPALSATADAIAEGR